jgi:hypothetical protein
VCSFFVAALCHFQLCPSIKVNIAMKILIEFEPHFVNCAPMVKVYTSRDCCQMQVATSTPYEIELVCDPEDNLNIEFTNKSDIEDNWLELKKIELDNINLQNFIFNGKFWPRYNANWLEQQDPKPPTFYCPGTHMRHEGVWQLPIKLPIYRTVLDFWIDDER